MDGTLTILTILGMALVTYLPRAIPLLWLSSRPLHPLVSSWLRYVPVAVLSAMLLPTLLAPDGRLIASSGTLFLWAALPTALVARKTRSFCGAVLVGIASVILGRAVLGL